MEQSKKVGLFYPFVWPAVVTKPALITLPMMASAYAGQWAWFVAGMILPWVYILVMPFVTVPDFRRGMRAFARHRNDEAVGHFQRQLAFLNKHPWFDIIGAMLAFWPTSSRLSFLCWNMLFQSLVREKRMDEALAIYERELSSFGPLDLSPAALSVMGLSRGDIAEVRQWVSKPTGSMDQSIQAN
jgi:pentatricopeptide repeat protein